MNSSPLNINRSSNIIYTILFIFFMYNIYINTSKIIAEKSTDNTFILSIPNEIYKSNKNKIDFILHKTKGIIKYHNINLALREYSLSSFAESEILPIILKITIEQSFDYYSFSNTMNNISNYIEIKKLDNENPEKYKPLFILVFILGIIFLVDLEYRDHISNIKKLKILKADNFYIYKKYISFYKNKFLAIIIINILLIITQRYVFDLSFSNLLTHTSLFVFIFFITQAYIIYKISKSFDSNRLS